jgi:hypothetical protein
VVDTRLGCDDGESEPLLEFPATGTAKKLQCVLANTAQVVTDSHPLSPETANVSCCRWQVHRPGGHWQSDPSDAGSGMGGNCRASHGACACVCDGDCDSADDGRASSCRSHSSIDSSEAYVGKGRVNAYDESVQSRHVAQWPGFAHGGSTLSLPAEPLCSLQPGQAQSSPQLHIDGKVPSTGHSV